MSRDWFRRVFIVNFDISQMFAEAISQSTPRFANVYISTAVMLSCTLCDIT